MTSLSRFLLTAVISSFLSNGSIYAEGNSNACGWVNFPDGWFSKAWCEGTKPSVTRQWSGTNTTFTGKGGWFYATWNSAGGNWIPDISRYAGDPNHWPMVRTFGKDYSVKWTGSGNITANTGEYTFGLKFELAGIDHWKDYDMTSSYECYIVTQSNRKDWTWMTKHIGVVYPPGSPVGYDCYKQIQGNFIQLWAVRQGNSWDGPVNVQAIVKYWADNSGTSLNYDTWYYQGVFICAETLSSQGWIRIENIDIPAISIAGTGNLIRTYSPVGWRESSRRERIGLDGRRTARKHVKVHVPRMSLTLP